ncbi:Uncharacterised protein [Klebsiella pneumoniae]|uniref:Uncharacterized protein n=1 Tax=Klebsiella pneumoniae TaxID=573 RepID=A0A486TW64_KLEPN|nr:Uncharacterised protein [Klebsiella pneumoniae]VGG38355.1 Uncharacterised protein [Klebsiella quasipneumoniae]SLY09530.1 Uncharacterised protein [Klebsiella pneumoniae]VFZ83368.1 Uncharacterised protein [Klebsiella pneumoniae]VGB04471.1 Uncharacterised protein [Klebsiella pneumoniae]
MDFATHAQAVAAHRKAHAEVADAEQRSRRLDRRQRGRLAQHRYRLQQLAGISRLRRGKQRFCRSLLHDFAVTHDQHIIGHFCHHSHIVGDQQQAGGKRLLQFAHQLEDLRLNSDVEGRGRLIGNQHLWLAQHCHGDHHPLAHTAGKLVRILLQALLHMTDFDRVQHRADPAAPFTAAQHFVALQRLFQLLAHRHQRIERGHRFLKNHGNRLAAQQLHLPLRQAEQILVIKNNRAAWNLCLLRKQTHDRQRSQRFTAARLAGNAQSFSRPERKADVIHHPLCTKLDRQALDREQRRRK